MNVINRVKSLEQFRSSLRSRYCLKSTVPNRNVNNYYYASAKHIIAWGWSINVYGCYIHDVIPYINYKMLASVSISTFEIRSTFLQIRLNWKFCFLSVLSERWKQCDRTTFCLVKFPLQNCNYDWSCYLMVDCFVILYTTWKYAFRFTLEQKYVEG